MTIFRYNELQPGDVLVRKSNSQAWMALSVIPFYEKTFKNVTVTWLLMFGSTSTTSITMITYFSYEIIENFIVIRL